MKKSIFTYRFRIKDSTHLKLLNSKAKAVNFVWNYCNEISKNSADRRSAGGNNRWISEYELNNLTTGSSKELGLNSTTVRLVISAFIVNRGTRKIPRLKWRSHKRNLGWIPVQAGGIQLKENSVIYLKRKFKFWKSREIQGKLKTASFNQDSEGRWYINLTCEVEPKAKTKGQGIIGIDLGLKTLATCSDGSIIENPKVLSKYAEKLAKAQRAKKKKQVTKIYAKIKNVRKDYLQKATTKLARENKQIFVGDVNALKLVKTKMAKSILDAGWGLFKSMLAYKALKLGIDFQITNEKYSTVTCSHCLQKTGPSGLSSLGVREWECSSCGSQHQRDVNAAKNILIFALGHESPSWESPCL